MNSEWRAVLYEAADGQQVVADEMRALGPQIEARILRSARLLQRFGILLRRPDVDHIQNRLWELRPDRYRVLYFLATQRTFVLLRVFTKKTQRTPRSEIAIAMRRMEDYEDRH